MVLRVLKIVFWAGLFFVALSGGALTASYYSTLDELPNVEELKNVSFETPMKIYTNDGKLIGEFGEHKRIPVKLDEIPEKMQQAFLAIEDSRFYEHTGIDPIGILRAVMVAITSGGASQGASTITQQVARNFFLTRDKTIERKIKEIFIAWRIEQVLTKEEILELYLNKIALGHRSYGVVAAAQTYYGKKLDELTLAEIATIAGLPKAPSTLNPITNPQKAKDRRHLVLQRMLSLGFINKEEFNIADNAPSKAYFHSAPLEAYAPYVAEEARQFTLKRFGEEAYTKGYKVYTTVKSDYQKFAQDALFKNLTIYDVRHGYRGPLLNVYDKTRGHLGTAREPIKKNGLNANVNNGLIMDARKALIAKNEQANVKQNYLEVVQAVNNSNVLPADLKIPSYEELIALLQKENKYHDITPGLIISIDDHKKEAQVLMPDSSTKTLTWEGMSWARAFKNDRTQGELPVYPSEFLLTGDVIFTYEQTVVPQKKKAKDPEPQPYQLLTLTQIPDVEGALLAINPSNGAIEAMSGGFDFEKSKFNRTTQLLRQTGSNFKPFIYSSAIAYNIALNSVIPDDPIKTWDEGSRTWWRPRNSPNRFEGPMTIREGLSKSKNSVSIRLIRQVGVSNAVEHLSKFDIHVPSFQQSESMALGTMELTPLQVATAYSTFANGGYKLTPFLISKIELETGEVLYEAKPKMAGYDLPNEVVNAIPLKYTDENKNKLIAEALAAKKKLEKSKDSKEIKQDKIENALNLENVESTNDQNESNIAPQIITHGHAYLVSSLMRSVIYGGNNLEGERYWGTGSRAATITGRDDLYGKTGTTNNVHDAWFSGFNANLVVTTWVGFDNERDLGYSRTRGSESGSATALPIFADFFKQAQEGKPSAPIPKPKDLVYTTNRGITEPALRGMRVIDEGGQKSQENTGIDSSDVNSGDIF